MENIHNRLKNSGKTLENDPSSRLATRPAQSQHNLERRTFPSKTNAVKGSQSRPSQSSLESRKPTSKYVSTYSPRSKQFTPSSAAARRRADLATESDDDDELDLLSGNSQHGSEPDPASSQKPVLKSGVSNFAVVKTTHASIKNIKNTNWEEQKQKTVNYGGKEHNYHRDFPPDHNRLLKSMSFKKKDNKQNDFATASTSSHTSMPDRPVSKENQLPKSNGPSMWDSSPEKCEVLDLTSPSHKDAIDNIPPSPLSGKSANSNRQSTPSSPSSSHVPPSSKSVYDYSDAPRPDQLNARLTMRPRPPPKTRAAHASEDLDCNNYRRKDTRSSKNTTNSRTQSESVDVVSPKRKGKSVPKTPLSLFTPPRVKPAPFPVKVSIEDSPPRSRSTYQTTKSAGTSTRSLQAFPMSTSTNSGKTKVKLNVKDKGKTKELSNYTEDEGEDFEEEGRKKPKPKAFPMSSQLLPGTSTGSGSRSLGSSRAGKRSSEAGSGEEPLLKKSRKGLDKYFFTAERPVTSPNRYSFDDEGDSMFLASRLDPSTLCPFCDTPLPSDPSPLLTKLIEATIMKARRDPRPTNPLGLKAPLTTYITLCQRHRFESQILPEAESKGWPKSIKWKKVSGRVLRMKDFLKALIEDPGDDLVSEAGAAEWEVLAGINADKSKKRKKKGPKAKSIFWVEFMDEVKKKGLRAVSGVRGQFANFEKAQPGYYGEMGSVIIHQTLYNMFPPADIDPLLVSPLTPTDFVQRILVPEVALHLIMEDRDLEGEEGVKEAFKILRDSSTYGVAMFPEDSGEAGQTKGDEDQGKMAAGDRIVMERARKRRKELAEEEVKEEEERKLHKEREAKVTSPKVKSSRKERQKTVVESDENSEPIVRSRPRPKPIPKKSTTSGQFSVSGMDTDCSVHSGSHPESETDEPVKYRKGSSMSSINSDQDMERNPDFPGRTRSRIPIDQSDEDEYHARRPSSEDRRRSPSASDFRTTMPICYSRAPSRDMSRLSLEFDSEFNDRAVFDDGEGQHSRRSKSRSGPRSIKRHDGETILKVNGSDDSEVEFVEDAKTPMPKRRYPSIKDDNTPRPLQTRKEMGPLELLRLRKQEAQRSNVQQTNAEVKTEDGRHYIFSSSPSQSN